MSDFEPGVSDGVRIARGPTSDHFMVTVKRVREDRQRGGEVSVELWDEGFLTIEDALAAIPAMWEEAWKRAEPGGGR